MNELADLKGIGPKIVQKLNNLGIYNIKDMLEYYPRTYVDKSKLSQICDAREGESIAFKV
jgi:ATP-dependent DNA helicase RecG